MALMALLSMEQGEAVRMRRRAPFFMGKRLASGPSLPCCRTLSGKERFWCIGRQPGHEPELRGGLNSSIYPLPKRICDHPALCPPTSSSFAVAAID